MMSAIVAVADGASVNDKGRVHSWREPVLPLVAAAMMKHHAVLLWLLTLGADPNGDDVMFYVACKSTPALLQLLIDAGGNVNESSGGSELLFSILRSNAPLENLRVLLAQPALDLSIKSNWTGNTPEGVARNWNKPDFAELIAAEASASGCQ